MRTRRFDRWSISLDIGLRVDELDEVFDNRYDVFFREDFHVVGDVEAEFCVDTETAHFAEVIALFGEEEVGDDFARRSVVLRIGVAELTIYILNSFQLGVGRVFLEGVEYDGVVGAGCVFLVKEDCGHAGVEDFFDVFFGKYVFAFEEDFGTFDRHNFAGCAFVVEVFVPGAYYAGCNFAAYCFFEVGFVSLYLFAKVEFIDNCFFGAKADSTQKRGYG